MKKFSFLRFGYRIFFVLLFLGYSMSPAGAAPIDYIFQGYGVFGTLNPNGPTPIDFNNANFLISISGDTSNVNLLDPLGPINNNLIGTMSLFGGDLATNYSGTFVDPLYVAVTPYYNDPINFLDPDPNFDLISFGSFITGTDLLSWVIPGIGTYDLTYPNHPLPAATSVIISFDTLLNFGGVTPDQLVIDDIQVPEPASMLFLGFGLVALFGFRRKIRS